MLTPDNTLEQQIEKIKNRGTIPHLYEPTEPYRGCAFL